LLSENPILKIETRRRIYNYIKKYPGVHQRNISNKLKIPYSTLYYHLRYLTKQDLIVEKENSRYNRYYIRNSEGRIDREFLNVVRQKVPRNIIMCLCMFYVATKKELSNHLDKHPTTIDYHLQKLLKIGFIELAPVENGKIINEKIGKPIILRKPTKNERLYKIKDRDFINKLMYKYNKSFFKDKAYKIAYELSREKIDSYGQPNKVTPFEKGVDQFMEAVYEIFPHPYHV